MLVIEAPNEITTDVFNQYADWGNEKYGMVNSERELTTCFLAGGITGTENWQEEVIKHLQNDYSPEDTRYLVIYNPRRSNFDVNKKDESRKQIEWEAKHLQECDVLSFYFAGGESLQPIALYEFGRYPTLQKWSSNSKYCIVSIEDGYKREDDVICQNRLACNVPLYQHSTPELHAQLIYNCYQISYKQKIGEYRKYHR